MSLRLLAAWLFTYLQKQIKANHVRVLYWLRYRGKLGYRVQGKLTVREGVEGEIFPLEKIIELCQRSKNDADDLYFDVTSNQQTQTLRLYRSELQTALTLEVLPNNEKHGVFVKRLTDKQLATELAALTTVQNTPWFSRHQYQYTPW